MKKIIALILMMATLICAFAGCSQQTFDPADGYRVLEETLEAEKYGIGFAKGNKNA